MTRNEVKNHEHQNTKKSVAEESDAKMQEFSCDICKKEFSQMPLLEAHIINEHLRKIGQKVKTPKEKRGRPLSQEVKTPEAKRGRGRPRGQKVKTPEQIEFLKTAYAFSKYCNSEVQSKLSQLSGLPELSIQKWFEKQRHKDRVKRKSQISHDLTMDEVIVRNENDIANPLEKLDIETKIEPIDYVSDHEMVSKDHIKIENDEDVDVVELKHIQPTKLKIKVDNGTFKMYTMPNHCETVTLNDVKQFLMKESSFPKKSGNAFEFFVKIIDDGDTTFEKCTLSSAILPNINGKITLECHTIQ